MREREGTASGRQRNRVTSCWDWSMDYELEWYLVTKSRIVWTLALGGCFFCLSWTMLLNARSTLYFLLPCSNTQITIYKKQHTGMDKGDQGSSVNGRMLFDARSTLS